MESARLLPQQAQDWASEGAANRKRSFPVPPGWIGTPNESNRPPYSVPAPENICMGLAHSCSTPSKSVGRRLRPPTTQCELRVAAEPSSLEQIHNGGSSPGGSIKN